jgi:Fe-Mn family superoxide dismutase
MYLREPLTYDFSALEPYIDRATMKEHYEVHYKKYTDTLNNALQELQVPPTPIENILIDINRFPEVVRNNAGGYYNHLIYFRTMSPDNNGFQNASPKLKMMIDESFGGYQSFKNKFKQAGLDVFGSGWAWLVNIDGRLFIATTKNQDNPLMSSERNQVVFGMDVWEHAYYLKHMADRKSYIDDFFSVLDWKKISERV